ncbi:hypothetical protein I4540_24880 [Klebsiella michiganensis]|jgi:YD repeat-containing protein|uniref:hypothetical protein n=2 Tax=Klebsiella michiganensis TaxID=1134687 RepID=UPI0005B3052E|nr:hypothetical protein [Klebsiella michiganensis]HBR5116951.1 hypothetical protein [Klebsiella pneumoniae]AWF53408.1 hypothetical protein CSC12_0173 [Klebsiella michiganensis]MBG2584514.1 hypothetical protein [Klebsiella michiganensis]MBG2594986.1 hypothetical protein [Klebsiella michiganensis]MCZ9449670.1 hypothetical protein [Klebsiella michiganensis]
MPVTKTISAKTRSFYPEVGIAVDSDEQNIEVTYTVISVTINADLSASARVRTQITGYDDTSEISVQFTYSGSGNPIGEVDAVLKSHSLDG